MFKTFTKGLLKENPTLRLVLGTCPTLAVTTMAVNGLGMGAAATVVLVFSNMLISLLRNVIPQKVRIPCYITIIAGLVSIVQFIVQAYAPSINEALGVFLPLITVNCIILGRAEMFASKNKVLPSILDGLGMGVGFTIALVLMGSIRELLGSGTIFGVSVLSGAVEPMLLFILPPGGFFVFAMLIAAANKISKKESKAEFSCMGCPGCPSAAQCSQANAQGNEKKALDAGKDAEKKDEEVRS